MSKPKSKPKSKGAGPASGDWRSWQLPPKLAEVELRAQTPEPLAALRSSPVRLATWCLSMRLKEDVHLQATADPGGGGELTPEAEAAVCAAAEFLAGRMDSKSSLSLLMTALEDEDSLTVVGVGGRDPGSRSHTGWLEAVGRAGVPHIRLYCLALGPQDFEVLARHTGLKCLVLSQDNEYPLSGLLLLPLAPRLETLELAVNDWFKRVRAEMGQEELENWGEEEDEDEEWEVGVQHPEGGYVLPPEPRGVLTALLCMGRRLKVVVFKIGNDEPDLWELRDAQLDAVLTQVRSGVEALGGDSLRLEARK
ncbi:hypothetical protein HYH03_008696 [Edaphochlamys debaryana]|uniref:Uncharacterized protein n=1 Tax=Edaphochlamys debaryana TaxID=47281 RepID=A0A836BZ50_9CHLO|nr:hypothetical protein HYH03_008696 [Edaphochlamys debaryana]|eukprot:KAG2493033.1 hypothetical protein HYH03_008696 [Edaphochlamys debaryana]